MATVELKGSQWKDFSRQEYAVIDVYGDQCAACVMLEPVFDGVADELAGIGFGRINLSTEPEIAEVYGIESIPTLLYYRKRELVQRGSGSISREEFLSELSGLLYR